MAFSDRIFQYYPSDMSPSGMPEESTDPLSYDANMPATSRQEHLVWQSPHPTAFGPSSNIVNPPPNSGSQIPYINSPSSVMHRAVPIHQQNTTRQQAGPRQPEEQERSSASQIMPSQILPWNYPDFLACGEPYRLHQPNDPPSKALKCHWEGCRYTGTFGRKAELKRHIEEQHISPKAYKCPKCGRPCNRDDNLNGHLRRVHKSDTQEMQM